MPGIATAPRPRDVDELRIPSASLATRPYHQQSIPMNMDSQVRDYYQYKPLEHREIRLLRIHRGSGHLGLTGEVHVALKHCDLKSAHYDALSYTWGACTSEEEEEAKAQVFTTVPRCYPIICDGMIIRVTKSLRDALRRLRMFKEPDEMEKFNTVFGHVSQSSFHWADGACIDQDNIEERGHQVALMAELYKKANITISYLGDGDEEAQRALGLVRKIAEVVIAWEDYLKESDNPLDSERFYTRIGESEADNRNAFSAAGLSPPTAEEWIAWGSFLSRPYFQRTWILQEVALAAPTKIFLLCGHAVIELESLLLGLSQFFRWNWNQHVLALLTIENQGVIAPKQQQFISWMFSGHPYSCIHATWHSGRLPFTSICRALLSNTKCSNPRDKIYATLGLAKDWQSFDEKLFPIDYKLSVQEVFCRGTKYIIQKSQKLAIVSLVSNRRNSENKEVLPSWCPDYAEEGIAPDPLDEWDVKKWEASQHHLVYTVDQGAPFSELVVSGIKCDDIEYQIDSFEGLFNGSNSTRLVIESLHFAVFNLKIMTRSRAVTSFYRAVVKHDANHAAAESEVLNFGAALTLGILRTSKRSIWRNQLEPLLQKIHELVMASEEHSVGLPNIPCLRKALQRGYFEYSDGELSYNNNELMIQHLKHYYPSESMDQLKIADIAICATKHLADRSMFVTAGGNLGIGHSTLRTKDEIWLLAGAKTPFVLRRGQHGQRRVVGEAYIHGMMFGEMWPACDADLEKIVLT